MIQSAVPRSLSCRWRSTLAVQKSSLSWRGSSSATTSMDSRVEHLTHPNQLVLCLTGREEWRRFSLSKTMSRACCDENDIVHTVLCSDLPVQLAIAAHMYRFMRVSHPVVTSLTLISPDLRVCCGLNSNRTSCSNSSSGAG
jgi:hypothetical protein